MIKSIQHSLIGSSSGNAIWTMWASTTSAFLMMFQIYMVAPIIGEISGNLKSGGNLMVLLIPSITLPLGISALFSGRLTSYLGERKLAQVTSLALALGAFLAYFSPNGYLLILSRIITGISLGSLLPLSFRLTSHNFSISRRFFPIMLIVFGMAGGMTFGPVLGAICFPYIGWRAEFLSVALISSLFFFLVNHYSSHIVNRSKGESAIPAFGKFKYAEMCKGGSLCILAFILLNGIFHSGLFVWTSTTLTRRYGFGDISVGMLLLDFGLPGLLLVVILGLLSKGPSRIRMEFIGLAVLGFCITLIMLNVSPWLTFLAIALLSIGYNITQPLFFGIVGKMGNSHKAQVAVQLGCCLLFTGYGLGPLIFGFLIEHGTLSSVLFLLFLVACLATISRAIFQEGD